MRYSTSIARFLATSSLRLTTPTDSETSFIVSPFQRDMVAVIFERNSI